MSGDFDASPISETAVTMDGFRFYLKDLNTWNTVASFKPCDKAIGSSDFAMHPKFSYCSEEEIYYIYWLPTDSFFLHSLTLADSADEEVLITRREKGIFAPGPGDTLVALNDTVYNLTSGERIPTKVKPEALQWNPANPKELLIATGKDKDLFLFNVETRKLQRINVDLPRWFVTTDARFSPDGKRIVLVGMYYVDGYQEDYLWLFDLPYGQ